MIPARARGLATAACLRSRIRRVIAPAAKAMLTKAKLHKSMATPNDDALLSGLLISLNAKMVNAIIGKPRTKPAMVNARRLGMNAMTKKGKAYKGKNTENKKLMKNAMPEHKNNSDPPDQASC